MPKPNSSTALYSPARERKYLNRNERNRFWRAVQKLNDPRERTFCEFLLWTGYRPSEALAMDIGHIDSSGGQAVIASLKKRGSAKGTSIRLVPIPSGFLRRLEASHDFARFGPLWSFGRTHGWRVVQSAMRGAGIAGLKASARGLRHSFGVHAVMSKVPETRIQAWMGHASLETTRIYLDLIGPEDNSLAHLMWDGMEGAV